MDHLKEPKNDVEEGHLEPEQAVEDAEEDYEDNEEMEDDLQEELEDDGDHILNDEDILDDEDKM